MITINNNNDNNCGIEVEILRVRDQPVQYHPRCTQGIFQGLANVTLQKLVGTKV